MKKNLPVKKQKSQGILSKTKSLTSITNKVLSDKISFNAESWMQRLWDWANKNDIPDLKLMAEVYIIEENEYPSIGLKSDVESEDEKYITSTWWEGLPRDKNTLKSFRELNITIKDVLKGIPLELFNLVNLKKLSIRYDFDKAIHNKYGENTIGIEFWNQRNEIENELKSNIPGLSIEIGKLKELIELNLSNNELQMLPNEIENLSSLKILNLSNNKLKEVPNIFSLTALETLSLSNNEILNISESIAKLDSLETLNLSQNKLIELPEFIVDFNFLSFKYLNLSGNDLLKLPLSICDIDRIDKLVISDDGDQVYPDNDDLKLTQKQKLWLFELEENGCEIEGYDSREEGERFINRKVLWWEIFDVWDNFIVCPTNFEKIKRVSFEQKENIDILDGFLAWVDNETGLMWEVKNSSNTEDEYTWKKSFEYTAKLNSENYAGFSDWILPNYHMLDSVLRNYYTILPITDSQNHWTSSPFEYVDFTGSFNKVADHDGVVTELQKIRNEKKLNVMCVRIFDINKALLFAVKNGLSDTVQILLDSGADVDIVDENMDTSLLIASNKGYVEIVQLLINAKTNVNHQNKNGDTALILASSWNGEDIVKLLLEANAEVNILNNDGNTALMRASTYSNVNKLQMIIDHNGLINIQNKDGNSAMLLAIKNIIDNKYISLGYFARDTLPSELKIIQFLLDLDAKVDLRNNDGDTVFDLLSKVDNVSTVNKETIIPRLEKIVAESRI